MALIYTSTRFKPKRKSRVAKIVEAAPRYEPAFKDLCFRMPAAYRPNTIPSLSLQVDGIVNTPSEKKQYTGDKLLGIGILHKSCLQPIFSEEQAIEIATMRR